MMNVTASLDPTEFDPTVVVVNIVSNLVPNSLLCFKFNLFTFPVACISPFHVSNFSRPL